MCDTDSDEKRGGVLTNPNCPAYVIAGGRSLRFGSQKATVEIDGTPQLVRLRSILLSQQHPVEVIADSAERFAALGIQCLVDQQPDAGPLAALATALEHRSTNHGPGWLMLIGCDQFTWKSQWFTTLAEMATANRQVVAFKTTTSASENISQPIPGLYHTSILRQVITQLDGQEFSLQKLLNNCKAQRVCTKDNPSHWSFNTPAQLSAIIRRSIGTTSSLPNVEFPN